MNRSRKSTTRNTVIRRLSTGDIVVFDDKNRDLYIIDAKHTADFESHKLRDVLTVAQSLVKVGKALHYDRNALRTLRAALANVEVLG